MGEQIKGKNNGEDALNLSSQSLLMKDRIAAFSNIESSPLSRTSDESPGLINEEEEPLNMSQDYDVPLNLVTTATTTTGNNNWMNPNKVRL